STSCASILGLSLISRSFRHTPNGSCQPADVRPRTSCPPSQTECWRDSWDARSSTSLAGTSAFCPLLPSLQGNSLLCSKAECKRARAGTSVWQCLGNLTNFDDSEKGFSEEDFWQF